MRPFLLSPHPDLTLKTVSDTVEESEEIEAPQLLSPSQWLNLEMGLSRGEEL